MQEKIERWFANNAQDFSDWTEAAQYCADALRHVEWLDNMDNLPISIKYYYFDKENILDFLYEIENTFLKYNWGGGHYLTNFRMDDSYFYCDVKSNIFGISHPITLGVRDYMAGMISGYLLAKGVEIL